VALVRMREISMTRSEAQPRCASSGISRHLAKNLCVAV
jgi:hypothetical protein